MEAQGIIAWVGGREPAHPSPDGGIFRQLKVEVVRRRSDVMNSDRCNRDVGELTITDFQREVATPVVQPSVVDYNVG